MFKTLEDLYEHFDKFKHRIKSERYFSKKGIEEQIKDAKFDFNGEKTVLYFLGENLQNDELQITIHRVKINKKNKVTFI